MKPHSPLLLMSANYSDTSLTCFDSMSPSPRRRDRCRFGTPPPTNGREAKRQGLRHYIPRFLIVLLLGILLASSARADQVTLKNGDRLTGSVVKSDTKTLTLKYFDAAITLPWDEVAAISSSVPLSLTLTDGQVLTGPVGSDEGKFTVQTVNLGTIATPKDTVQAIRSKEEEAAYQAEIERLRHPALLDLWDGYFDAGLAGTQGNADTTTINLGLNAVRATTRDKTSVFVTQLYSANSTTGVSQTTANAVRGGIRYDLNFTKKLFGFAFTTLEFDEFQSLDLRFVAGGGPGYHVINNQRTLLDIFVGGSYNKEFFSTGLRRSSGELLVGDEFSHKVTESFSINQRFTFYPNMSDTGSYRLNWDCSAVTRLSRWLSWQVTLSDRFLSNPVPGRKKNDVLYTTGLRFTFSREK
jgi:putative salt-induced outer membrane protein YdiY